MGRQAECWAARELTRISSVLTHAHPAELAEVGKRRCSTDVHTAVKGLAAHMRAVTQAASRAQAGTTAAETRAQEGGSRNTARHTHGMHARQHAAPRGRGVRLNDALVVVSIQAVFKKRGRLGSHTLGWWQRRWEQGAGLGPGAERQGPPQAWCRGVHERSLGPGHRPLEAQLAPLALASAGSAERPPLTGAKAARGVWVGAAG